MSWVSFTDLLPCADRTSSKKRPKVPGINFRFSYFHPKIKSNFQAGQKHNVNDNDCESFEDHCKKGWILQRASKPRRAAEAMAAGRGETVRLLQHKLIFSIFISIFIFYICRKGGDGEVAESKKIFSFLLTFIYISYLKGKRWGCLSTIYTVNFPFIFKLPLENTLQSGAILETLIGVRWKERKARELMSSEASKSTCWRSYR